jgi:hypothetical protein
MTARPPAGPAASVLQAAEHRARINRAKKEAAKEAKEAAKKAAAGEGASGAAGAAWAEGARSGVAVSVHALHLCVSVCALVDALRAVVDALAADAWPLCCTHR